MGRLSWMIRLDPMGSHEPLRNRGHRRHDYTRGRGHVTTPPRLEPASRQPRTACSQQKLVEARNRFAPGDETGSESRTESREAGLQGRTRSRELYEAKLLSGLKGAEKHQSCHSECLTGEAGGHADRCPEPVGPASAVLRALPLGL